MTQSSRLPIVTLLLITANIVAAFGFLLNPFLVEQWGFSVRETPWYSAPVSLFIHANTIHLLGNMIFLAAVGAAAELATGSIRFFAVYALSGLVGIAVYAVAVRGQLEPPILVGASGSIAGCAAYYSFRYTQLRVPIAPKFGVTVAMITGLWFLLQLIGAVVQLGGPVPGTAFLAHAGGFVTGLALSFIFKAPDLGELSLGHRVLDEMNHKGPDATVELAKRHLERHPEDLKIIRQLADAYQELGQDALEAPQRVILATKGLESERLEGAIRLADENLRTLVPLIKRLQLAESLPRNQWAQIADLVGDAIESPTETVHRPDAIFFLANAYVDNDPQKSKQMLDLLQLDYPVHGVTELAKKRGLL